MLAFPLVSTTVKQVSGNLTGHPFKPAVSHSVFKQDVLPGDTLSIRFSARKRPVYFSPKQMAVIQNVLNQCSYMKDMESLLKAESRFEAFHGQGRIVLKNYNYMPVETPPFKGVCNNLAFLAGHRLQKQLGQNYIVKVAAGPCDHYFEKGLHVFLLAWPRKEDARIQAELRADKRKMPEGCLLIDPSFKKVILDGQGYHVDRFGDLDVLKPRPYFVLLHDGPVASLPMGLLKDICPGLTGKYGEAAMVYFQYRFEGTMPVVVAAVQPTPSALYYMNAEDILTTLPEEHVLNRFYTKLTQDLKRPWADQMVRYLKFSTSQAER